MVTRDAHPKTVVTAMGLARRAAAAPMRSHLFIHRLAPLERYLHATWKTPLPAARSPVCAPGISWAGSHGVGIGLVRDQSCDPP
jgi:hypothetical protein